MGTISGDKFTTSSPAIQYTIADETWTVDTGWLVFTSGNDAVNSAVDGSTLINNGNIISGDFYAVDFTGDRASVTNNAGHQIASQYGILLYQSGTITNHGTVLGYGYYGVLFDAGSQNVVLNNDGDIYGRLGAVFMTQGGFPHTAGGTITNSGTLRSDHVGILAHLDTDLTMAVVNTASGTISGGDAAIESLSSGNISLTNSGTIAGLIDLKATAGNDVVVNPGKIQGAVFLGDGADTFVGSTGTSGKVFGEDGTDHLTGSTQADQLDGGAGTDTLIGGRGRDLLTGGADADHFTFKTLADSVKGAARDMILDFTRAQADKIDLAAIDANTHVAGNNAFHFIGTAGFHHVAGELRRSGGIIQADVNGDAVADFEIHVNLSILITNDFAL